jgi:hypothetical protein
MGSISGVSSSAPLSVSAASELLEVEFSTTVGKKTYGGEVAFSDGAYVASASNLPGVEASGPNLQAAESNLSARIDTVA